MRHQNKQFIYKAPAPPAARAAYSRHRRVRRARRLAVRLGLFAVGLCAITALAGALNALVRPPVQAAGSEPPAVFEPGLPAASEPAGPLVVAVDAGHGGEDTGAIGLVEEWQMTESTARALIALLEQDERFAPVLCRDWWDKSTPTGRAEEAARQGAQLLISIHGNSWEGKQDVQGFECYPVTPGMPYHQESLRFAQLVAQEMQQAGAKLRGETGVRYIYFNEKDERVIHEESDSTPTGMPTFSIVEKAGCAALLVEQCFVTSAGDVDKFGDEDGCQLAAQCYYRAICAWAEEQGY